MACRRREALRNYKLDASLFVERIIGSTKLERADVIVDAVYGFGYHGALNRDGIAL